MIFAHRMLRKLQTHPIHVHSLVSLAVDGHYRGTAQQLGKSFFHRQPTGKSGASISWHSNKWHLSWLDGVTLNLLQAFTAVSEGVAKTVRVTGNPFVG